MQPDVQLTVLMPVYNAGAFISDAIASVLVQDFTAFELLIINDGSTDDTAEQVNRFGDHRIRLISQPNMGIAAALNNGLVQAKGIYIARFDADDVCMPGRLSRQLGFLLSHPDHVAVGCEAEYITREGEHLFGFSCIGYDDEEIRSKLYVYCPFIHSGVMYRKQPVFDAGGYFTDAHNFEDYLLWVRLARLGKFHNLREQLIQVRFHPDSVTIDEKWRGARFRQIKRESIQRGFISRAEGDELLAIIRKQEVRKIKEGSYYALCGKKYLLDNYQPARARSFLTKAIKKHPARMDNYALYLLSFFPWPVLQWLHQRSPNTI
jgi:glycosyltransferase involved in cell wall biosynthesis